MRAQAVLASTLSGYLVPFRAVDDPIDPAELPPDTRRQLRLTRRLSNPGTWPIVERALDYLKEQEAIDPQAIANLIKTSTLTARAIGLPANAALTQRINAELRESIARGEGAREWSARLRGIIGTRSSYEETISRTATHRAYLDGQRKVAAGPAGDRFQYRTYAATRDTRTRKTHRDMDGKVYHKDSPMAVKAKVLLDQYNCRCTEIILTRKQAVERGIDDDTGWVEPVTQIEPPQFAEKVNAKPVARLPDRRTVYEAEGLHWTRRPQSQTDRESVVLYVDVAKLDAAWRQDAGRYLPAGSTGESEIAGRRDRFEAFVPGTNITNPIEMPRVALTESGGVSIEDGRHRTAVLRDRGYRVIPVLVEHSQLARAKALLGSALVEGK